jgi:hypothetical protein
MMPTIVIDGRKFPGILEKLSSAQCDYIHAHIRLAGSAAIVGDLDGVKRTPASLDELLTQILLRGEKTSILAGFLVEEGKVWTWAEADRNAARFDAITDPGEIRTMTTLLVDFMAHCFESGKVSAVNSRRSPSAEFPPTKNAARPN